jgi:hypothetical protein
MCVFKYHAFIFYIRPPRWRCKTIHIYVQGLQAILIHNNLLRYTSEGADMTICLAQSHVPGLLRPKLFKIFPMCYGNIPMATPCGWPGPISQLHIAHTHFQWVMTYDKTDCFRLLRDRLYIGSLSGTIHTSMWTKQPWWGGGFSRSQLGGIWLPLPLPRPLFLM